MKSSSDETTGYLLQQYILPLFAMPDGGLIWQGSGELDAQRHVYYFCIDNDEYVLVNEPRHGFNDVALARSLVGNVVAPHQKVVAVSPKNGAHTYVNVSDETKALASQLTGDFSMFRILS